MQANICQVRDTQDQYSSNEWTKPLLLSIIHPMNASRPTAPVPSLDGLDLNLLRVFDVLMQERRVATASSRLGLSQPAVSNALSRLRKALGDEILTRAPSGMEATEFAKNLHATLGPALAAIEQSLRAKAAFDPLHTQWRAQIAMTDIGEIVFLPALIAHCAAHAPGLMIETLRDSQTKAAGLGAAAGGMTTAMAEGRVDLAIGWLPDVTEGLYQRKLFTQRYVCIARQGHPLLQGKKPKLTLEKFLAAEHVAIRAEGTGHTRADEALQKFKHRPTNQIVQRKVRLQVPHFLSVPPIVANTDLIATVPERLAQECAGPYQLQVLEHPVKMPAFELKMFWHRRVHTDPANQWLRAVVAEFFAQK
jgi:DNA-binding transcriptional LysR family regulator